VIKIDVEEMTDGAAVARQLRGGAASSLPWMTILDADGNQLISSDGPDGNIGCPISEGGCEYFLTMFRTSSQHATEEDLQFIREKLEDFAEPYR
jgi:hypothetical protein